MPWKKSCLNCVHYIGVKKTPLQKCTFVRGKLGLETTVEEGGYLCLHSGLVGEYTDVTPCKSFEGVNGEINNMLVKTG